MEREILFRGFHKQADGPDTAIVDGVAERGRWVYGYYVKKVDPFLPGIEKDFILTMDENSVSIWNMVDPSTVGQWTGLTDKNGKKIFEGDVVRYGDTTHRVVFEQRNGTAYFGLVYDPEETLPFDHYQDLRQITIIGTIYDAPPEGAPNDPV